MNKDQYDAQNIYYDDIQKELSMLVMQPDLNGTGLLQSIVDTLKVPKGNAEYHNDNEKWGKNIQNKKQN